MDGYLVAAIGGVLIGLAVVWLMASTGRIAGISGIAGGLVTGARDRGWRLAFVAGLLVAPGVVWLFTGHSGIGVPQTGWPRMLAAGLLVGVGTRLGRGCTSGHGVCGVARFSPRSILATATFVLAGIVTVALVRLLGGSL